ncbi:hypothetical protein [Streptomyces alkaliterrae]|uniref:Secreted protein n=1 Tax=Streptomyces alkaliterrae TaxID=2213162 RepID=A0A5P0YWS7_9ACTN|nr:hypothetical protein [Streptomyces alkaliterrae]MBB1254274.1 hypothetical protein [Streptomyces alkaliterrae]MBB1261478.1 hypothetical protein [Streptomyces alkaliterrae]MQS04735.1 hypothetical protein [Streptomyces alkaliterrae]
MRKFARVFVSVVAAGALVAVLPTSAQAARGSFAYRVDGYGHVLNDPEDYRCYNTPGTAGEPSNHTDRVAVLHRGAGCADGAVVNFLEPGMRTGDVFGSVRFISR